MILLFKEDLPNLNPFTYFKKGFRRNSRPTSFYGRPFWLAKYNFSNHFKTMCDSGRLIYKTVFDINEFFMKRMNHSSFPYFFISSIGEYTHDSMILPPYFDVEFFKMLKSYEINGYFDNTLLIIFSDHGSRLVKYAYETESGRREKKQPFISIKLPKKLVNTEYYTNMVENKNALISFFDVYQTLRHFLALNTNYYKKESFSINNKNIRYLRGISLFDKIPENRNCSDALISESFCVSNKREMVNEENFQLKFNLKFDDIVDYILNHVNNQTSKFRSICSEYRKYQLKFVKNIKISSYKNHFQFITIFQPGDAWFESNIEIDEDNNNSFKIVGKVVRLSLYGYQSSCIKDGYLKNFCFCKSII